MPPSQLKLRDELLLIIHRCQSRPEFGRTSLQKVAYFASIRENKNIGHRAHFYGPYSPAVETEVEALTLSGFIEEKSYALGFASKSGFAARKYEYRVTDSGLSRLEAVTNAHPHDVRELNQFLDKLVEAANGLDQKVLSAAAKTLYIARATGKASSLGEISDLARGHGWDLSPSDIAQVVDVLRKLGLVEEA
jgi:uncharacterized protein YwgA